MQMVLGVSRTTDMLVKRYGCVFSFLKRKETHSKQEASP